MERFLWSETFCVGDDEIDTQHKKLFQLLADLQGAINRHESSEGGRTALKALLHYTQAHFADEEALMQRIGYAGYENHKQLHDELMDRVWDMYTRHKNQPQDVGIELLTFINDWLVDHILEADKEITAGRSESRFLWREAFRIGEAGVDNQHKKIFQLLANLHRDIHGKGAKDAVSNTLKELLNYTQEHFSEEEALMQRIGYPDYAAHKRQHDDLMDKVWAMYIRSSSDQQDLGIELLSFLNDWLTRHILEVDMAISRFIREQHQA